MLRLMMTDAATIGLYATDTLLHNQLINGVPRGGEVRGFKPH